MTNELRHLKTCHKLELYVWLNGALMPLQFLREEWRRRFALMESKKAIVAGSVADSQ